MSRRNQRARVLLSLLTAVLVVIGLVSPAQAASSASTTATVTTATESSLTIAVTGTGFAVEAPGVYVGLAERGATATAASLVGVAYVPATAMTAVGGFSAQLDLDAAAIATLDPTMRYAVHTVRAHNMPDEGLTQSTSTDIELDWVALGLQEPAPEPTPEPTPTPTSTETPDPTPTQTPTPVPGSPVEPSVSVSQVEVSSEGATTVTVTGSGFDPAAVTGTRPPFAGQSGGVYVVFGKFAEQWRPSQGAPSSARVVGSQVWAVPQAQVGVLGAGGVVLSPEGSFTAELVIDKAVVDAKATVESLVNYGVFTYPGSGASNAAFETYTPIEFMTPGSPVEPSVLAWGIKESFRSYVAGQGTITLSDGVTRTAAGFDWPFKEFAGGTIEYGGSVHFSAHGGALDVTIADPQIRITSSSAALLSAVVTSDGNTRRVDIGQVALGSSTTPAAGMVRFVNAPVTLLSSGVEVFGNYPAGAALDPVTLTIARSALESGDGPAPVVPTPTAPTTPAPGSSGPATASRQGAGYLLWGIKQSFRDYVVGPISKGSVVVSLGASSAGGAYRFGQSSTSAGADGIGTTSYRGTVRFTGHGGVLDLTFSNPTVVVRSSSSADLIVTAGGARVTLATLDLASASVSRSNGTLVYSGAPARITPAGRAAFNGYASGYSMLDPVTFAIGAESRGTGSTGAVVVAAAQSDDGGWVPPATPPATTGAVLDADTYAPGDVVRVTADGFAPGEVGIRIVVYSDPVVLATEVTADDAGRVAWSGTLPTTLEPGEHTLTVQGSVARGAGFTVAQPLAVGECIASDASLVWGFKESFRAYISGTIANGSWEVTAPASYATPVFTWPSGSGTVTEDLSGGTIAFEGGIEFTGHDGALTTGVSRPRITFLDAETAVMVVDFASTDREEAEATGAEPGLVETPDVEFVRLDLSRGQVTRDGDTVTLTGVPAVLTAQGGAVFPTYAEGEEFDTVDLTFTIETDCTVPTSEEPQTEEAAPVAATSQPADPAGDGSSVPWWILAVIGAVLIFGAGLWLGGRGRVAVA